MNDLQELQEMLTEAVAQWLPIRRKTIQDINDTAEKLQEYYRKKNIEKIISTTGGVMTILFGVGLAPVTFGASLAFSVVGISLIGAAAVTFEELFIEESKLKEKQKQFDRDFEIFRPIQKIVEKMEKISNEIHGNCSGISISTFLYFREVFPQGTFRTIEVNKVLLNIVLKPIDLITFARSTIRLENLGSQTKAIEELKALALELEKQSRYMSAYRVL